MTDQQHNDVIDGSTVDSIAVYVCTHKRNGPLERMLDSLQEAANHVQPAVRIAVVVVDDNPDGRAKAVVDGFSHQFVGGLHYRFSGAQNISLARNAGLEAAMGLADWVAMTDDDQVVIPEWFDHLIATQQATNADAVTGPVILRYDDNKPGWVDSQPFEEIMIAPIQPDQIKVEVCSTGNSMMRASFLREHPEIRFRPDLGRLGGEDMVFYRAAVSAGLHARYSAQAIAYGEQPPERATYRYHLRTSYWLGNTEYLTNIESGDASPRRLALRASRRLVGAVSRPLLRLVRRQEPQWRFTGALAAQSMGMLVGVAGVKVEHT